MAADASVLIPAYNEEATIAEVVAPALRSGLEVVVVDDGSSDKTGEAAAAAGAKVVRLPTNSGKGAAYAAGLDEITTTYVVLLDADLVGLRPQHVHELLGPVARGECDMAVGVFRGGRLLSDFGNRITPQLSGQRALKRELLKSVPHLAGSRYDVELKLTYWAKKKGLRVKYLPLFGLGQRLKEEKRGFLVGVAHRLRMYLQILKFALFPRA